MNKGWTLIELLITVAILSITVTGLVRLIGPCGMDATGQGMESPVR